MVVTYHIWFGRVSGGVDIFLLISAFLLTLSFVRKLEAGRALDLGRYWLHMFKRLLPAVVVVLLGILVAAALFVPRSRWSEILSQTWSSLFYFQNWALAANSVDYYATDQSIASPLQHFWSLSVQGQVFILWPLLFALAGFIAKAAKIRVRRAVLLVFGSVFAVSLTFSIYETYTNQVHAYFDTRTRLWEFAFGTLLVLALPYLKIPRPLRVAAGWIGLAAMLSGGFILDVQGQFPGYVALWPLVAAALIILAGQTESPVGADRLLTWKPLIRLGDMSYALYLWHWPVLIIYMIWRGREEVGPVGGTAIILLSLLLAYLTTRFVERPLRSMQWAEKKKRRAAVVVAVCVLLIALPVAGWQVNLRIQAGTLAEGADRNNPGALAMLPGYVNTADDDAPVLPRPEMASKEWPDLPEGCTDTRRMEVVCDLDLASEDAPRVVVAGSSHAQMWLSAVRPMAEERGWNLGIRIKGFCPITFEEETAEDCLSFNRQTMEELLESPPALVITTGSITVLDGDEYMDQTWASSVAQLREAGSLVVAVRDTPRMDMSAPVCVEENESQPDVCGIDARRTLADTNPAEIDSRVPEVAHLDFTEYLCAENFCPAVIGNVLVYLDNHHLTRTYIESLRPIFEQKLDDALAAGGTSANLGREVPPLE
ncbi:acyltransferase [Arthrobacter gandavensis]|nr:acyltransferase [Arthrobacter gandavensis]